ncbi:transposase [Anaerococcus sp. AGMB09787]
MSASNYGNIDLNIPRDREGTFEPQALRKYTLQGTS